ncbi:MAG: hypothetical protein OEZ10_07235 [Gammaproteobacteria bacterium]|nr:hypothetical protein [Gammaproteobacteria bacterium]
MSRDPADKAFEEMLAGLVSDGGQKQHGIDDERFESLLHRFKALGTAPMEANLPETGLKSDAEPVVDGRQEPESGIKDCWEQRSGPFTDNEFMMIQRWQDAGSGTGKPQLRLSGEKPDTHAGLDDALKKFNQVVNSVADYDATDELIDTLDLAALNVKLSMTRGNDDCFMLFGNISNPLAVSVASIDRVVDSGEPCELPVAMNLSGFSTSSHRYAAVLSDETGDAVILVPSLPSIARLKCHFFDGRLHAHPYIRGHAKESDGRLITVLGASALIRDIQPDPST